MCRMATLGELGGFGLQGATMPLGRAAPASRGRSCTTRASLNGRDAAQSSASGRNSRLPSSQSARMLQAQNERVSSASPLVAPARKLQAVQSERTSPLGAPSASVSQAAPPKPVGITRAKAWCPNVEDCFRLQEAGYMGLQELLSLGQPTPERWECSGFIRKLRTKHSIGGAQSMVYFRRGRECEARYVNRVKLYRYG